MASAPARRAAGRRRTRKTILQTEDLTRAYGAVTALDHLDLVLKSGECVAIMGPNGSGKTTAAEVISGLLEPTGGWARVCGYLVHREPQALSARRHMAFVADTARLYDDLTVADHLRLVAAAHGAAGHGLEDRCERLLERLGLEERSRFFPSQLSRGMRQKTAIACALIRPYSLLILDEPVVGLDTDSIEVLGHVIRESLAARRGVLLMTHSDAFAATVATRILHISEGRLIER